MSRDWTPGQEAGAALILSLIDAARAYAAESGAGLATMFNGPASELVTTSRMLDGVISTYLTPRQIWRAGTWVDVSTGDRVRLGGHEAVVASAVVQDWHVDPRGSTYRPVPLEHRVVAVRLGGGEKLYTMPPDGPVEILDVEFPEESLAGWVAAAGACLEVRAVEELKRGLGAKEMDQ
jgi:hypothetical protein